MRWNMKSRKIALPKEAKELGESFSGTQISY